MSRETWDSYPALVNGEPASILVALHFEEGPRPSGAETLCVVGVQMLDPGEHGMGSAEEAEAFAPFEDALAETLGRDVFVQVGRLRNESTWQLSFYGPKDANQKFLDGIREHPLELGREVWTHVDHDPDWNYYRTFLLPDQERRQWMANSRLVGVLQEKGDPVETPRRVEHGVVFPSLAALQGFREQAAAAGFDTSSDNPDPLEGGGYLLEVSREDAVELNHIHGVVLDLTESARPFEGRYEGWSTPLLSTSPE